LTSVALLGLMGCGAEDEDDPYLPTGEGRQGGSGGGASTGNNGGDNNATPAALASGELIYLRDNNGGTDVLYPSGDAVLTLARLVDAQGADLQVAPGDLAIGHDGARLFYIAGGALYSSAVDGSGARVEADGLGDASRPRVTSDGGAVIFIGDGGAALYRLTLADGQVSDLNVSQASCQSWVDLVLRGTSGAWAVRSGCAQALDGGLVEVRFATGSATTLVTATELSPQAQILALGAQAGADEVYLWGSGALDFNGDAAPDSDDRQALYVYDTRRAELSYEPFFFANPQAYGRGLGVLGNDQVVVDLVQPNNQAESGLYVLSPSAGTFQVLQAGTDLSSPTAR
jgi:hypothetical protein